jgi:hypothetical protein
LAKYALDRSFSKEAWWRLAIWWGQARPVKASQGKRGEADHGQQEAAHQAGAGTSAQRQTEVMRQAIAPRADA